MKKILAILLSIMLIVSMTACKGEETPPGASAPDYTQSETEASHKTEPTTETQATDPTNGTATEPTDNTNTTEPTSSTKPTEQTAQTGPVVPTDPSISTDPTHGTEPAPTEVPTKPTEAITEPTEAPTESTKPSHVHSYSKKTTAATCTDDGYTTYTCSCGNSYKDDFVSAKGHTWGNWETKKQPTTAATGLEERVCSVCCKTETRTLDKLIEGHTHQYKASVTKQPTCTNEGVKTFTCSCGAKYTENIAKIDHQYKDTTVAPTCTENGYTKHTCTACGYSYTDNYVATTGHNYKDTTIAATCTTGGYTKHTCKACGHSYSDNQVPATGHNYVETSNTATCTNSGTKTETCQTCGNQKTTSSPATGHQHVKTETQEPSCMYDGYVRTVCSDCGTVISQEDIPSTGNHNYTTMRVSEAAKLLYEEGETYYIKWMNITDWNVHICKDCLYLDETSITLAYSQREAAEIMLGYVNELRRSVYGTNEYDLVLDDTLIEIANIRAKEISIKFEHGGSMPVDAGENINSGYVNIYDQYVGWYNSPGHYQNMIYKDYKYFGYGTYRDQYNRYYGVQLFWTEQHYWVYQ